MKGFTRTGVLLATGVLVGWLSASVGFGQTVQKEKAREFLEGLRERGYYDTALEYLQQIGTSPRCPDDLKETIDYEAGVTLVSGARKAGTVQQSESQLDEARSRFEKFIKEHPKHPLATTANTQLGNVMVQRGHLQLDLADQPSKSDSEKNKLRAEARKHFQAAAKVFQEAQRRVAEKVKSFPAVMDPKAEADKIAQRDKAREDQLRAKLYLAGVTYDIAKTYPEGSKQYKDNLTKAAAEYHKLYTEHGSQFGGLHARMLEGRAYKELGRHEEAINVMREMMTLPDEPQAFRTLKNQSMVLMLETYLLPKVKRYQDAIEAAESWKKNAQGREESNSEGLAIHYLAGLAALSHSEALKPNDPERKASRAVAKRHFEFVARFPGDYQRDARTKLMDLAGDSKGSEAEPTNYAEAKNRADLAWGAMVVAMSRAQAGGSAEARNKAAENMAQSRDEATKYYRMALAMRTPETPTEELNLLRFRLTYLYWAAEDYYRSAVLGEFLATRYPDSAGARKGGEIAVKSYRTLFTDAARQSQDTSFEAKRIKDIADYITTRWADQPEAQEAWMMLIDTAVDTGDLDGALAYLDKIDMESPHRARAELKTGQAFWQAYARASAKPEDQRPPQEELDKMVETAQQTLEKGVQRMRKGVDAGAQPDYALVYSVLSLAQIYVDAGQSEEAVQWLDDPKVGPMTLVRADAPVVRGREQFAEDTYKAALRAYVGAQKLDDAEKTMGQLERMVSAEGDAEANERLTQIYIRLGQELQDQLKRLRQEGKTDKLKRVSQGFELFLKKISEREEGNDFRSLNWVAETFYGLGAGMDPGGKDPPAEAQDYYRNAARTYVRIVKKAAADPEFAPPEADISVKVRLAKCLAALGAHQDAMEILVSILRSREKRLDVQLEAARTYQDWGEVKPGYYEYAIKGGQEYQGRYLVWGWGGIATRLAPFINKYESTFHEARYNLAVCRQKQALAENGDQKDELLKKAKLDILRVFHLYPSMGGPQWYAKYDSLLKTIQKLLGEKATGLK